MGVFSVEKKIIYLLVSFGVERSFKLNACTHIFLCKCYLHLVSSLIYDYFLRHSFSSFTNLLCFAIERKILITFLVLRLIETFGNAGSQEYRIQ